MADVPNSPTQGDHLDLRWSVANGHTLTSALCTTLTYLLVAIAVVPLFSVLYMLLVRGLSAINWQFLTSVAPTDTRPGGIGNAIVGSLTMVAIAAVVSVPTGVLGAIYMAEYAPGTRYGSRLANAVRACGRLLTGLPSIIAGMFLFSLLVLWTGTFSAVAGGLALAVLMVPVVLLTSEEAIKAVPRKMREAAFGMGCTRAQVIWFVLLPTALPGILTGIMLALARALGETAPLLLTAKYANRSWVFEYGQLRLMSETQSLSVYIFKHYGHRLERLQDSAWGAAFVLVIFVLIFNLGGQLIAWKTASQSQHR